MSKKKVQINYDTENDVLYLSFGSPTPSYTDEDEAGVLVRYDFDTDEVTGITILNFSKRAQGLKGIPFISDKDLEDFNNLMQ